MRTNSRIEIGSLAIAIIAIVLSGVSTWKQFFHRSSTLHAVAPSVSLDMAGTPAELRLSVVLMNSSETPGVLRRAYLFLSADRSTPQGAHSTTPNERFWWGESLDSPIVIGENSIHQIELRLQLDSARLARYQNLTDVDPDSGSWSIGVALVSMDIEGNSHLGEAFVGELLANGFGVAPGTAPVLQLY